MPSSYVSALGEGAKHTSFQLPRLGLFVRLMGEADVEEVAPSLLARVTGEAEAEEGGPLTPAVGSTVSVGRSGTPLSAEDNKQDDDHCGQREEKNSTRLTNSRCARVVGRAGDRLRAVVVPLSSDGDSGGREMVALARG